MVQLNRLPIIIHLVQFLVICQNHLHTLKVIKKLGNNIDIS